MATSTDRLKHVWFLPWVDLHKPLSLGKVEIWPATSAELHRRFESEVANHLEKYFESYVDHGGTPVKTISICSYGNRAVSKLGMREEEQLRLVVDILAFSTISSGYKQFLRNPHSGYASADKFALVCQTFSPGNDALAINYGRTVSGGWTIGQIKFPKPWCVGAPFQSPDERLFKEFEIRFAKSFPKDLKLRLSRSLQWYRLAQTDAAQVTTGNKVVMLATAIECLLAVPKDVDNKQLAIAEWIDKNCTYGDSLKKTWSGSEPREHSAIGHWVRSFYDLRNSIVHGEDERTLTVQLTNGKSLTHLHLASLVFWECVCRKLLLAGAFADIHQILENCDDDDFECRRHFVSSLLGVSDVHRNLGWLPSLDVVNARNALS